MEQNICQNCFQEISQPVCPHCGWDPAAEAGKYPLALPCGSILNGRYILGRPLGQGGFGITYVAQDDRTGQRVAIKEFFPEAMATRTNHRTVSALSGQRQDNFTYGLQCFLSEAKTLAQFLGAENIVRVHSYFEENGTAYFAMDYVDGISLQAYLRQHGGRISWEEATKILFPVMDALTLVHSKGIVHRDVSPDNIFITNDGKVKLLDFGAARYSLGDRSRSLDVVLKAGYAPMEQYTRRGRQGPFTDVYSLAATFYMVLTGHLPPDSVERMEEDNLILPSSHGAKLPVEAEDAIEKALAVRAPDRYQSIEEFRSGLLGKDPPAPPVGKEPPPPELPVSPAPSKKSPLPLVLGAIALVAVGGILAYLSLSKSAPEAQPTAPAVTVAAPVATAQEKLRSGDTLTVENIRYTYRERLGGWEVTGSEESLSGTATIQSRVEDLPVVAIGDNALKNREAVSQIIIPSGITTIGNYAFSGCTSLKQVFLSGTVTQLGDYAFMACTALEQVSLPDSVQTLGIGAFAQCASLSQINIPEGVSVLSSQLFQDDRALDRISIPKSVTRIGAAAFQGTGLSQITVSAGTVVDPTVGVNVSYPAGSGTSVHVEQGTSDIPESLWTDLPINPGDRYVAPKHLANMKDVQYARVPEWIENVGREAFKDCSSLKRVQLPATLTGDTGIGIGAFKNCSSLEAITIPPGTRQLSNNAFYGCASLTEVTIPASVPTIEFSAFEGCTSLRRVVIEPGVTKIEKLAFQGCYSLEEVVIPDSVKTIEWNAFNGCTKLQSVEIGRNCEITTATIGVEYTRRK